MRFVFTTGGTGLTPDDVTPEATRAVIERDAPAFQQAMLIEGLRHQPMALLTRGVSGIAGRTLIVNFPGSPKAIDQLFPVLAPALQHAAESLVREGGAVPEPGATPPAVAATGSCAATASGPRSTASTFELARRPDARRLRTQRRRQVDAAARARDAAAPARRSARACSATTCRREGWAVRGRIGFLGHDPLLYGDLTRDREPRLPRAPARPARPRASGSPSCSRWPASSGRADDRVHTYSRGMVQRLAVCRAVLHDPDVLLLDEPRANLDPAAGDRLEPLIGRASGRTRVVTSHDPAGGLAEADLALGLRAGRAGSCSARPRAIERRRGRARSTRTRPRRRGVSTPRAPADDSAPRAPCSPRSCGSSGARRRRSSR